VVVVVLEALVLVAVLGDSVQMSAGNLLVAVLLLKSGLLVKQVQTTQ
jgi:hypothetical protein